MVMLQLLHTKQNGYNNNFNPMDISEEDKKLLLSLLQEYSDKLRAICSEIEQSVNSCTDRFILSSLGITFLVLIFTGLQVHNLFSQNISYLGLAMLFIAIVSTFKYWKNPRNKKTSLIVYAKMLGVKLDKLVKTVSQLQEHFPSSYVKKVEVELRLSDAESTLAYYNTVFRRIEHKKNKAAKKPLVKD
jgi:hypothetical protein